MSNPVITKFIKTVLDIKGLPGRYAETLEALLYLVNSENTIVLNAALKRRIAAQIKSTESTINNYLTDLVKSGILIRQDKGLFTVNPDIFGTEGKFAAVTEIKLNVTYEPSGIGLKSDLRYKPIKAARKTEDKPHEPTPAELEAAGQTTILDAIPEEQSEEPKVKCPQCDSENMTFKVGKEEYGGDYYHCNDCSKNTNVSKL